MPPRVPRALLAYPADELAQLPELAREAEVEALFRGVDAATGAALLEPFV